MAQQRSAAVKSAVRIFVDRRLSRCTKHEQQGLQLVRKYRRPLPLTPGHLWSSSRSVKHWEPRTKYYQQRRVRGIVRQEIMTGTFTLYHTRAVWSYNWMTLLYDCASCSIYSKFSFKIIKVKHLSPRPNAKIDKKEGMGDEKEGEEPWKSKLEKKMPLRSGSWRSTSVVDVALRSPCVRVARTGLGGTPWSSYVGHAASRDAHAPTRIFFYPPAL